MTAGTHLEKARAFWRNPLSHSFPSFLVLLLLAQVPDGRSLGALETSLLRSLFFVLPKVLRLKIYGVILKAVDQWDPQPYSALKFLPFGLGLTTGHRVYENEANALGLIEKHIAITAPRLIDFTIDSKDNTGYLLMTTVPGVPADGVLYRMTYEEREQLSRDLGKCISQYRKIPNRSNYLICDTLGGPLTDHRTGTGEQIGPYNSKADFLNDLTDGVERCRIECPVSLLYGREHGICFTHSDLHLSNLMVKSGRLCGIIDWENAGFRPEYWEYTRAPWAYEGRKRFEDEFSLAFEESYRQELEAEKQLWRLKPEY